MFEKFGFQSGRNVDKLKDCTPLYSDNGLIFLPRNINAFMSLKVEQYVDLDTHGMFICSVTESRVISDRETMTYSYYQSNVKPKPETKNKQENSAPADTIVNINYTPINTIVPQAHEEKEEVEP